MNASVTRLFILLLLALLIQCRTFQSITSASAEFKKVYMNQFKLTYFRKILAAGFNNSEAIKTLIRFGFTEPVLTEDDYRLIDSLVHLDNKHMMADSSLSIGRVAEGAEGKHVLEFILTRLEGKWLDSLANRRYKHSGRNNF